MKSLACDPSSDDHTLLHATDRQFLGDSYTAGGILVRFFSLHSTKETPGLQLLFAGWASILEHRLSCWCNQIY